MADRLFQFAVILHPTEKEAENGKTSELVVEVQTILAATQEAAMLRAGRSIPEEFMDRLARLEVSVRPF